MRHQKRPSRVFEVKATLKPPKPQIAVEKQKIAHTLFIIFFLLFDKTKIPRTKLVIPVNNPEIAKALIDIQLFYHFFNILAKKEG